MYTKEAAMFMYKYNAICCYALLMDIFTPNQEIHRCNTRNKGDFNTLKT